MTAFLIRNPRVAIPVSGEDVAELFWDLSSREQAKFFNHLSTITSGNLPFQLSAIVNENVLNICGRLVMSTIGDYGDV